MNKRAVGMKLLTLISDEFLLREYTRKKLILIFALYFFLILLFIAQLFIIYALSLFYTKFLLFLFYDIFLYVCIKYDLMIFGILFTKCIVMIIEINMFNNRRLICHTN